MNENTKEFNLRFTVRNVLRALCALCTVFVFCPAFLVSCSGQNIKVSVMTAVGGMSAYGEKVVDPHPIMLVCLLIPVVALVLLFVKKLTDKNTAIIMLIGFLVDFIFWLCFRAKVKEVTAQNYCEFKTTAWFVFNIIALLLIIILSVLILIGKICLESNIKTVFTGAKMNVDKPASYCGECGNQIPYGSRVCSVCGMPVADDIYAESQNNSDDKNFSISINSKYLRYIIGIPVVAVALIIFAVVSLGKISENARTINLDEYVVIKSEGYDGFGTASASIDWDGIEKKYGSKIKINSEIQNQYGGLVTLMKPMDYLKAAVNVSLDKNTGLANGDVIKYTLTVDEGVYKTLNCKLEYENGTKKINTLQTVETFDVFEDLEVKFEGCSPNGTVSFNYVGEILDNQDFVCDKNKGLQNGDIITISLKNENASEYAEAFQKIPKSTSKEYKVSGLKEYIISYSQISDELLVEYKAEAEDVVYSYIAKDYDYTSSYSVSDVNYEGYMALYPKKSDEITDNFNYVFFIYSATVSSKNNKFNPTKVYYPVRFKDIVNCDEMEYEESSKKIVGDFYFEGSFNDSVGYRDPNTMYSDIVTANRDTYKSEVSETFKYLIQ